MAKKDDSITIKLEQHQKIAYSGDPALAERVRESVRAMLSEPSSLIANNIRSSGIVDLIDDYRHRNFGEQIQTARNLLLYVKELELFLDLYDHFRQLEHRFYNRHFSTTIIFDLIRDGNHFFPIPQDINTLIEAVKNRTTRPGRTKDYPANLIAGGFDISLPPFVLLADDLLIEAEIPTAMKLGGPVMPYAFVWKHTPNTLPDGYYRSHFQTAVMTLYAERDGCPCVFHQSKFRIAPLDSFDLHQPLDTDSRGAKQVR